MAAFGAMFLIDGIPAIYFDKTFSEQTLINCAKRCIELFAPNLILGISDEIASTGDIGRIRLVGGVLDDYNASLQTADLFPPADGRKGCSRWPTANRRKDSSRNCPPLGSGSDC